MKVTWGLENAAFDPKTITTIGSYDGLHLGHREIIARLQNKKGELGLNRSLLLTFDPHPQEILRRNNTEVNLLTTIGERLELLASTGIDEALVIKFSQEFSRTPYRDFFRTVLIERLGTKGMVVGFNHAFGKNREGDIEHLRILAAEAGISVEEVPPLYIGGVNASSTKIRHALLEGNIELANAYLGRPYDVSGLVEEGDKIGRTLGIPTANIAAPQNKLIPADGVYGAVVTLGEDRHVAAISIGKRPTVTDSGIVKIEAHILDFDRSIYGQQLRIQFLSFIRSQTKFDSVDQLKTQMNSDIQIIRETITLG